MSGIYDKNAIKLILEYGITAEQFKQSPCFKNPEATSKLLNIIESNCKNDDNKIVKAQEIFSKIGAFSEAQLTAVECNLDIDFVANSDALQSRVWKDSDKSNTKNSLFLLAARNQDIDTMKVLIAKGADMNTQDSQGNTALHISAYKGNSEIINYLINIGLNMEAKNNLHLTPLMIATNGWKTKAIETLLEVGANPEGANKELIPEPFEERAIIKYFKNAIDNNNIKALMSLSKNYPELKEINDTETKTKLLNYALMQNKHDICALMIAEAFQHKQNIFKRLVGGKSSKTPDQIAESIGGETLARYISLKESRVSKEKREEKSDRVLVKSEYDAREIPKGPSLQNLPDISSQKILGK